MNLTQWRAHILHRLRQKVESYADPTLSALLAELTAYASPEGEGGATPRRGLYDVRVVVPLRLLTEWGLLGTTAHGISSPEIDLRSSACCS